MPPHPEGHDVREVLWGLLRHPIDRVMWRWNWKTAALTAALRGAIFFTTNLPAGLEAALAALGRDLLFRVPLGGCYGAISQAFSGARPAWAAYLVVAIVIPAIAHVAEFLVHWLGGTPRLQTAITVSILFSALSAVFNVFLMRRGAFLVGGSGGRFRDDLVRLPGLVLEFLLWVPRRLGRR